MNYLYSVAVFMLIYKEKKDVLKRFKIYSRYIRKGKVMLTINQLMKYLRIKHNIVVKSNQAQDLRNMGYYHGFKGYRFIRVPSQRISFTSLDEIIALNKFDMQLKALFYPKVMFIENGRYLNLLRLENLVLFLHVQIRMLNCIHQQHCTSQVILMQMGK